jgi:uncharacterized membrane-anchored protein YhcB (DUF1043 family)
MKAVTEKTLVPLSLVIAIGGGIYKFSEQSFATEQTTKDLAETKQALRETSENVTEHLKRQGELLGDIRMQMAAIDARLSTLSEYLKVVRATESRRSRLRED